MRLQLQHFVAPGQVSEKVATAAPDWLGEGRFGFGVVPGASFGEAEDEVEEEEDPEDGRDDATPLMRWPKTHFLVPANNIMEELQIEYFVPLSQAVPALEATWGVAKHWGRVVEVSLSVLYPQIP
jgi:hypothetical protein